MDFKKYDDEYLIAVTNKGTVNRAYKDLLDLKINITESNGDIVATFSDITVNLKENLFESSCSCPSKTLCKHIVMSVLHLRKSETQDDFSENQLEQISLDIDEIVNFPEQKLLIKLNSSAKNQLYSDLKNGNFPNIEQKNFVLVELFDGHKVRLFTPLKNSVCGCKSSEMCRHKALAILYYKAKSGFFDPEILKDDKKNEVDIQKVHNFCKRLESEIADLFYVGLSRLPNSATEQFEKLALYAHNSRVATLEKNVREISAMLKSYFNRDIHFSEALLLKKLTDCFFISKKIIAETDPPKLKMLIGSFRDEYIDVGEKTFIPLGERYFETLSGYAGNVYYFLEQTLGKVYSFSDIRPTFYDIKDTSSSAGLLPWDMNCDLKALTEHIFTLKNPKANFERRLSSSKETKGFLKQPINKTPPIPNNLITYDFRELVTTTEKNENDRVAFVMAKGIADFGTNSINQVFYLTVTDKNGFPISIELKINAANKDIINTLEMFCKNPFSPTLFIGIVYQENGQLKINPIDYFKGFKPI